ncbi:peptidoglycan DD-metalloendopeptidase family protein [Kitasatospora sp. NPDC048540]|uniref:peptidoglycan DD-metalloendopeptidase family protein n=1 Tax=Kitasatospora sp. NPDC048540 TaxID=3155634 RepID=UPI0033E01A76
MHPITVLTLWLVHAAGRGRRMLADLTSAPPSTLWRTNRRGALWVGALTTALVLMLTVHGPESQTVHPTTPGSSAFTRPGERIASVGQIQTAEPKPYRQTSRHPEQRHAAIAPNLSPRTEPGTGQTAAPQPRHSQPAETSRPAQKEQPAAPSTAAADTPRTDGRESPSHPRQGSDEAKAAPHARPGRTTEPTTGSTTEPEAAPEAAAPSSPTDSAKRQGWSSPVPGARVTNPFGKPDAGYAAGYHTGTDFGVPVGTAVLAVSDATVVSAGNAGAYGQQIVLRLKDGKFAQYAHLSRLSVTAGETVQAGEQIGRSGNTGNSTGPHLHFEIRTANSYGAVINPVAYLRSHGADNF